MDRLNHINKTKTELKTQVREFYEMLVEPDMPEYDKTRKKDFPIYTAFTLLLVGILLLFTSGIFGYIMVVFALILIFSSVIVIKILDKKDTTYIETNYEDKLKKEYMPAFLDIFGNLKWKKYFAKNIKDVFGKLKSSKIFPNFLIPQLDDTISGNYADVNIDILEVKTDFFALNIFSAIGYAFAGIIFAALFFSFTFVLPVTILTLMHTKLTAIYTILYLSGVLLWIIYRVISCQSLKAIVVYFKLPKNFTGQTFVYENASSSNKLIFKGRKGYEAVKLEDLEFEKRYNVYSTNQIEARYLLTTGFMERFLNIKTAFNAKYIRAEFKDGELTLVIGVNKDLFQMGGLTKQTTGLTFLQLFEELYSILSLVEYFKLDEKTGL